MAGLVLMLQTPPFNDIVSDKHSNESKCRVLRETPVVCYTMITSDSVMALASSVWQKWTSLELKLNSLCV